MEQRVNSSSWWASKLGGQPAAQQPTLPPVSPPAPARLSPVPQPTEQSAPNVAVTGENFSELATLWQGGEATRTETARCPQCGGDHFFSRSNTGSRVAARCYDCGYTEGRQMQGLPPA